MKPAKEEGNEAKRGKWAPPDLMAVNNRDPRFAYRWIKVSDRTPVYGGIDPRGWEVVKKDNVKDSPALNGVLAEFKVTSIEGTFRIGDLILARMPKETAEERKDIYLRKNRLQVEAIKDPKRFASKDIRNGLTGSFEITREN